MSSERVVQRLLERRKLTGAQVEEARRTQQFFGGQLLSHLIRLGFLDEPTAGEALAEAWGCPYAPYERLRSVPVEIRSVLPRDLVERHFCHPLALEKGTLQLAMVNPRDAIAIRDVEAATDLAVEPQVATEHRLAQALQRHYGIRGKGVRGVSLAAEAERPAPGLHESGGGAPAHAAATGDSAEVGLDGLPLDADASEMHLLFHGAAVPVEDAPPAESRSTPAPRPTDRDAGAHAGADDLDALERALAEARDRDALAACLLRFCRQHASRAALFAVSQDGIRGVAAAGRAIERAVERGLTLASGSGSGKEQTVLHTVLASRDFYFGGVPPLPGNRDLYSVLGGRIPPEVMAVPLTIKGRTVALLYLDNDDRRFERPDIALMRRVAAKAGLAFEILLLRNKMRAL